MPRLAALLLAALLCAPEAPGQTKLAEEENYKAGLRALEDRLPDLALPRLRNALAAFPQDAEARRTITLKLGEAAVRAARMESNRLATRERAQEALEILAAPDLAQSEPALFWSAQASLLLTDFPAAEKNFARLAESKDPTFATRARLSRAHLLATMGQEEEADALLTALRKEKDPQTAGEARLLHASLLLAQGKLDETGAALPADWTPPNPAQTQQGRYLRARLALARKEYEQAATAFAKLEAEPAHLGATFHLGTVGLAEALHLAGKTEAAVDKLVRLVDQHPRTPHLEGAFVRLVAWAQTDETLKARMETKLAAWAHFQVEKPVPADAPAPAPATESKPETGSDDEAKTVIPKAEQERAGYARYYYASYLAEKNAADSNSAAERLLQSLRSELPNHPLVPASLIESARLQSAGDRNAEAIETLKGFEEGRSSPTLEVEATKLIALLQFKEGNKKAAAEAFLRVRKSLEPQEADLAAINAGVSFLSAGEEGAFHNLLEGIPPSELRAALQLEHALHRASLAQEDARPLLDRFIAMHRDHPRIAEARLARAEEWLRLEPQAASAHQLAKAELDEIRPDKLTHRIALRHLLARFKLAELTSEWGTAIKETNRFLKSRATGDMENTIRLKLAEAYFNNGDLGLAQREFQQIAAREKEGLLHEVALFFAAKAALKLRNENPSEAAKLLRRVIANGGTLAHDARLLLVRSLIEQDPEEALETLAPLLTDDARPESQLDALVLAAEANRALGTKNNYLEAIKIYDRVLAREDLSYANSNRFHSLKGQIYELLKDPGSALETYYRVVNRENLPAGEDPSEWRWFTECGFKAVQILEEGKRWPSALEILRKLEESGSPWRKEAEERRLGLQLERQQWESE